MGLLIYEIENRVLSILIRNFDLGLEIFGIKNIFLLGLEVFVYLIRALKFEFTDLWDWEYDILIGNVRFILRMI